MKYRAISFVQQSAAFSDDQIIQQQKNDRILFGLQLLLSENGGRFLCAVQCFFALVRLLSANA